MRARLNDLTFTRDRESRLTISTRENVSGLFDDLHDVDVEVSIKRYRRKRSLDANAYAWVLMDKLAEKMHIKKEDVYRVAIQNVGGNTETVCVKQEAAEKLRNAWEKNGLGWMAQIIPSKLEGCKNVILYYGSSTFDTAQMSRMIDNIVQDCKAVGIETMTPGELERLLESWK